MHTTPPSLLGMIGELIAIPSISSVSPAYDQSNLPVIECLAAWMEDLGMAVEVQTIPGFPGKANLIATLGSGPGGLVLAGHTDTVPYDEGRWQHDPFRASEADGRLYGLGTADMKAFLALAIEAARDLRAADLSAPLIILATADEESSMCGAEALVAAGRPRARHAIIGEPTGLRPIRQHKGILMEAIRLQGRAGHSSDPSLGISALEGMHRVITALLAWRGELQAQHRNPLFHIPYPTMNLGHIHGGDNPNRICGQCELHIDLRPVPGMEPGALRAELRRRVDAAVDGSGLKVEIAPLFAGIPPLDTPATAAIVQAVEALTGHSAEAVAFGTEGPFLQALGMDTVILGPGDIAQAHQPDEFLEMARLQPTIDLLRQLIVRFCMADRPAAKPEG